MKANELMIGDWVLYDEQPYQIRQLGIFGENRDGDDYPAVCVGKPNGMGFILEYNEIDPIPLTPEILETVSDVFTRSSVLMFVLMLYAFFKVITISSRDAFPALSPRPLIVHCACCAPASIAAKEFATAKPKSLWQ